jgi:dipeptidyl aminopeptidase/acylaminoacyl peptidase
MAGDGETDLHGVLYKPFDFDPNRTYPVVEWIYAGPHVIHTPRTFPEGLHHQALAHLGYIVILMDGRGTPGRGKAFQDVAYGSLGRHEIPDHAGALRQLARDRPYMDLSRTGIVGSSYGGYFAIRALLLEPGLYRVGIAASPAVDMFWGFPPEIYLGHPSRNPGAYEHASLIPLADRLEGRLLIVHGTADRITPFGGTLRLIDAFVRAGRPYDLIVLPDEGHGFSDSAHRYWREAVRRFFEEHLRP